MINGIFTHKYRFFFLEAVGAGNSNSLVKLPVMNTRIKSHEDGLHPCIKIVIGGSDNRCNNSYPNDTAGPEGLSVFCFSIE